MAKLTDLNDLFLHTLKDVLYAERRLEKALPKMAKQANSERLEKLLMAHHGETVGQIERLEKIFDMLDKTPRGAKCEAILGIIEESEHLMEEISDGETRDAAIVASCQAAEHYEITRYGTLAQWANRLGHDKIAKELAKTLDEEKAADEKLSDIAREDLNKAAA